MLRVRMGTHLCVATFCLAALHGCAEAHRPNPFAGVSDASRTLRIAAAVGAEIVLDDGATLTVPPDALDEDVDVTFARECVPVFQTARFGGCRYTVSGLGAVHERLDIALPSTSDDACVLAELAADWRCLADSESRDSFVYASFDTPRAFTTRVSIVDDIEDDKTCANFAFEPCGGDVEGTWDLVRACARQVHLGGGVRTSPNPYASCGADEVYRNQPFSARLTWTFSNDPGSTPGHRAYRRDRAGRAWERTLVTEECLASVGESCACESNGFVCECVDEVSTWVGGGGGSYRVEDDHLILDHQERVAPHCVRGDELVIEQTDLDGSPYHFVFRRR